MQKGEAKERIRVLVKKFEAAKVAGDLGKYTEEDTKKDFIMPLFEALGWDTSNRNEVSSEENIISQGRVDYGFYINGRVKFYLEAKKIAADLNKPEFADQAVRYSWNKGVTWAILTDFEGIKILNAQVIDKYLGDKIFIDLSYKNYEESFDQLWLLSRESIIEGKLDQEAEKWGKLLKRVPVNELLYKDLARCREILTQAFSTWNKDIHGLDEGVQRVLDRIVFIRVLEDRSIEPPILIPMLREWQGSKTNKSLYQYMKEKFLEFDQIYNSHIFATHASDAWEEHSDAVKDVIEILYGKEGYYEYDFKIMPADILGKVYEQYLGYQLTQSKKKKLFGSDLEINKDAKKRKEQGIYYTPTYIVDFIVKNTLGPVLDNCQSIDDLKKIKVLDPACGSGSFLVQAFELIKLKYIEFGSRDDFHLKYRILLENIYGVDLDEQAIEIARLNLLINTVDERRKLPSLEKNIRVGNSLISGTDLELEKQFGKNYRDKRPFNWQEEFSDVFKQGGFDVVVGNPPWGADIDEDVKYYAATYPNSTKNHKDIYKIFLDKGISLLRDGGSLGFIVPNTFLYQPRFEDIKEIVNRNENFVINLGEHVFQDVQLPSAILILEKKLGTNKFVADLTKGNRGALGTAISTINSGDFQKIATGTKGIVKNTGITFDDVFLLKDAGVQYASTGAGKVNKGKSDLPKRIFNETQDNIFDTPFYTGSNISKNKWFIDKKVTKYFRSSYKEVVKIGEWVHFTKDVFDAPQKIVWRQTSDCIKATIMDFRAYFGKTVHAALIKDYYKNKVDIYYALAIFNSKYIDCLYRQKVMETGKVFPQVKLRYLRDMPFVVASKEQQKIVSDLAKKMITLSKELHEIPEHSDKWESIKKEIERTDQKIDEEVYKLYDLSPQEVRVIEESTKKS